MSAFFSSSSSMSPSQLSGIASEFGSAIEEPTQEVAAHVIVLGNEKGGSGKTTSCMHLMVSLLRLGFKVGSIDIDSRQRSLTRYIENRRDTMQREGVMLPMPQHAVVQKSPFPVTEDAQNDERERFGKALEYVKQGADFVVIDTPGNDTFMSRLAHSYADTVITPINDSFVDLDVLAQIDGETMRIIKPSIYSEMVWEQKLKRAKRDGGAVEWIVMRNRLSNIDAKNKRQMTQATEELARRIGFRAAPGFSERVIFRELFLQGLTVLDIMEEGMNISVSMSHIAARQEVRDLLKLLKLPKVDTKLIQLARAEEAKPARFNDKPEAKAEAKPEVKTEAKPEASATVEKAPEVKAPEVKTSDVKAEAKPAEAPREKEALEA